MAKASPTSAFPTWRDLWSSIEGVPLLLTKADALLQRRSGGLQMPFWNQPDYGETLALATRALRSWANGGPPKDPAARPQIARIHAIVQPLLQAAAWPRWLLLERAFLDASETGDLLFAALTLRTMCEEVQRLHALDINADRLAQLVASTRTEDQERVQQFYSFAWVTLDSLPQDMVLYGKNWPSSSAIRGTMRELEAARQALNSYVHPNYGSHIAALFPECTAAASLLLGAVVAVYEAFFSLSWSEQPAAGSTGVSGPEPLEPWRQTAEKLQSDVLPEVHQMAQDPALAEMLEVPAVIEWLTAERPELEEMLRDPISEPLLRDLPRQPMRTSGNDTSSHMFRMWDGACAIDVINFACARRAEEVLRERFPSGAPSSADQIRWLQFNAHCIELAMLLDLLKAAAFKTQLARQITQRNTLGILLCVRSLIEHRALASWLTEEVRASLSSLAGQLRAGKPLPQNAAGVEQTLANFLAVQAKRSKEDQRSWVIRESGGVRSAQLNLSSIVEGAFTEDDRFRKLYALSSAAMHARSMRGYDLLLEPESQVLKARYIGLLVLERVCSKNEKLEYLASALRTFVHLNHAAAFGGTSGASNDAMVQQAFGRIEKAFESGIDYVGEGTAESPFQFGSHLQLHLASYELLTQLGVDVTTCPRVPDHDTAGNLCDRWRALDRDYWFQLAAHNPS